MQTEPNMTSAYKAAELARQVMALSPQLAERASQSLFLDDLSLTVEPCGGDGSFERVVFSFIINPNIAS